jgi:hypothetical protein
VTGDQSHVTKSLAQFVAGSQWDAIPPEVRCEGVRGLLNFVGCALGGARDEAMDIAVTVLAPFFGAPQAIVIGRGGSELRRSSRFSNAISACLSFIGEAEVFVWRKRTAAIFAHGRPPSRNGTKPEGEVGRKPP